MKLQANSSNGAAALAKYRMILNSVKRQHPRMSAESARAKAKKLYAMYKRKLPAIIDFQKIINRLGGKKMLGGLGEDEVDMEPAEEDYVDPEEEAEMAKAKAKAKAKAFERNFENVLAAEQAKAVGSPKEFMAELRAKRAAKAKLASKQPVDEMMMDAMNERLKELKDKAKAKRAALLSKQPAKYSAATMAALGKLIQESKMKNAKKLEQLAALPSKKARKPKQLSADKLEKQLAMCDSSRQVAVRDLAKTAMKLKLSAKELSVIKKSLNKKIPSKQLATLPSSKQLATLPSSKQLATLPSSRQL